MSDLAEIERRRGEALARKHPVKAATKLFPRAVADAEIAQQRGDEPGVERALARGEGMLSAFRSSNRCGVCGRDLSDPRSVSLGIGPDCLAKKGGAREVRARFDAFVAAQRAREAAAP